MANVQTVRGSIDSRDLGVTLMHEHLLLDARKSWQEPKEASRIALARRPVTPNILHELRQDPFMNLDNCTLLDEQAAAEEVEQFKLLGGATVVDATCRGIGRDPLALQRISQLTGLNIVMGTGYYLEDRHPPYVRRASIDELADEMVVDLLEGVDGTDIRAGYLGEIGIGRDMTSQEEKALRAATRAQVRTGVALSIHLPGWERLGHRVIDVIEQEGGDPSRTVLDHMNPSFADSKYQKALADRGAYLEYDMIGMDYYFADQDTQCPSDDDNARAIAGLIDAGYVEHLLLSQDVFLKMMLTRYGGNGYAYISRHFLPRLRRHGVEEQALETMMVTNPARVLGGTS